MAASCLVNREGAGSPDLMPLNGRPAAGRRQQPSLPLCRRSQAITPFLLINTLEPFLRGEKMTPEQFKEMLRYVKTNKRKAAADMLASYAEGTTEQP